jgi:hypothetical protein
LTSSTPCQIPRWLPPLTHLLLHVTLPASSDRRFPPQLLLLLFLSALLSSIYFVLHLLPTYLPTLLQRIGFCPLPQRYIVPPLAIAVPCPATPAALNSEILWPCYWALLHTLRSDLLLVYDTSGNLSALVLVNVFPSQFIVLPQPRSSPYLPEGNRHAGVSYPELQWIALEDLR